MGPEKAAYRGGCRSLPEPPEGAIRHERRYHDPPPSPARIDHRSAHRDCARGSAPDAGGGAEGRGGGLCRPACRRSVAGWSPARCPAWHRAGADDPDRDRADPGAAPEGARSGNGHAGREEDPLHLEHPAAVGAAFPQPRCAAAGALSARGLDRGFSGSLDGASRNGGAEPVARRDLAPHGGLAGGLRPLAAPQSVGPPLRRSPALSNRWRSRARLWRTAFICRPGWRPRPNACW